MYSFASWIIPSNYRSSRYIKRAEKLLVPEIRRRQELMENGSLDAATSENVLSWMMQCAKGAERDPSYISRLTLAISLAAVHTSQAATVHVLYDLAERPEYVDELRNEIRNVASENGGSWNKGPYAQLRKMDSFMRESQRFNPPSELSYQRMMTQGYRMHDGTYLPKGTHIAMPVRAIQHDPDLMDRPENFDGLRYYRLRQNPKESNMHQFATTGTMQLNFGHGKFACPGRFFASLEIKCILVYLIMNYDFKLVGTHRPENLRAHEYIFPNPEGELLIRKRKKPECPF